VTKEGKIDEIIEPTGDVENFDKVVIKTSNFISKGTILNMDDCAEQEIIEWP